MKKVFALAFLVSGLMAAAAVYAHETSSDSMRSSDMSSSQEVKAAVVSKSGDTIRLYVPDAKDLCEGENIPIFRATLVNTFGDEAPGEVPPSDLIASSYISDMKLVGEVRIDRLEGDNYAEGTLVAGEASPEDIASKPSSECLTPQG